MFMFYITHVFLCLLICEIAENLISYLLKLRSFYNTPDERFPICDCSILKFEASTRCEMKITLNDVKFYGNRLALIQTLSMQHNQQNVLISTEGNFTAEKK